MDQATIAATFTTANPAATAIIPPTAILSVPFVPAVIAPPFYETTLAMANKTIGTLPSPHPCPNHSSIQPLERDLFNKLQAIQSSQSEEWGFLGLAKQPTKYALKSATPWANAPNPGPHHPVVLNTQLSSDLTMVKIKILNRTLT